MLHLTKEDYPCTQKVEFENFKISDDLLRYKNFLAEQTAELKTLANQKI